MVLKKHL